MGVGGGAVAQQGKSDGSASDGEGGKVGGETCAEGGEGVGGGVNEEVPLERDVAVRVGLGAGEVELYIGSFS